jgi:hypothetical protein
LVRVYRRSSAAAFLGGLCASVVKILSGGIPGTSMSKPLSRRSRDFFAGIPNIYSASPGSGCQAATYETGSIHHNEVA